MKTSVINTFLLIGIIAYLLVSHFMGGKPQKHGYVLTGELFSGFAYQEELNGEFETYRNEKTKELDQIREELVRQEERLKAGVGTAEEEQRFGVLYRQYQEQELALNKELTEKNTEFTGKIWSKLTAFTKEYGEENGYDIIYGADGNGNIMYADSTHNVTKELLEYCNQKFNGK